MSGDIISLPDIGSKRPTPNPPPQGYGAAGVQRSTLNSEAGRGGVADVRFERMSDWIETHIPARLDRLPWSAWHWFIVAALGATWILDGLEVTLAGALGGILTRAETLGLSDAQVGASATFYLGGAVLGALGFGYATDRLGRKKLFFVTVGVYLTATALTAFSWNFASYAFFRALTGAGIGGEYAAINSAIDELIPARVRGRVDLIINGSYWIGAALGSAGSVIVLNPRLFPMALGWRLVFGIGALLGLVVIFFRQWIPESPRWLLIHGRAREAEEIINQVERHAGVDACHAEAARRRVDFPTDAPPTRFRARKYTTFREIWDTIANKYRQRALLGFVLMVSQAFFYNAIFFTYALVLMRFYDVPAQRVGGYLLPFALGNFLGPLLIGRFFDTIGRKALIVATYAASGILLAFTGWLFREHLLTAPTQTIAWTVIFFVASAAASSAYLTVSEIFPLEIRAFAIAVFYSIGTLAGGVFAPLIFGIIIGSGSREALFGGYLFGAALMIIAAATEAWIGVRAERQSLESIAAPLSSAEAEAY
ncbi:MAG TPA: MFS transporter [Chthoniobacterales bacterium]|nr:MFS transporter [Chthoniobacterales bacterium]